MGGEIGVVSAASQGSTFWFVVPLKKGDPGAEPRAPADSSMSAEQSLMRDFAGAQVLLSEDEPLSQDIARFLLEDVGLRVDLAKNGQEAVELARKLRYALILMDMQMPTMNGIEATRAIRSPGGDSPNKATPILALTANAFDDDREACLAAGMNDHIVKPIDPQTFYMTLLRWLERRSN